MKKRFNPIYLFSALIFLVACGKDGDSDQNNSEFPSVEEQVSEGSYRAILRPMNNSLSGFIPSGVAEIKIVGDSVQVKTLLDDDAGVAHMQNIHISTRCPGQEHDLNQDGIVDIVESYKVTGSVLVPLDADLSSDEQGRGIYPVGRNFTYQETVPLKMLEDDVRKRTGENLNLAGRVVLIHGTANDTQISDSVQSLNEMSKNASVPIACGVIYREVDTETN